MGLNQWGQKSSMGVRPRRAVLISLSCEGEDVRVTLDDAESQDDLQKLWLKKVHITSKLYASTSFDDMEFDDKELAEFGFYILARLSAFLELDEN